VASVWDRRAYAADLLVLLPVDTTQHVTDVHLQVTGENGLEATAPPDALAPAPEALETHTTRMTRARRRLTGTMWSRAGWHVSCDADPYKPGYRGVRYPLRVTGTYQVAGESGMRTFSARRH